MKGRRSKPTQLKIITGNPGKRKLNKSEPKPDRGIPPCPDRLTGRARDLYQSAGEHLDRMGILTHADGPALELLAGSLDEYFSARDVIREAAERVTPEILGEQANLKDGLTYKSMTQNDEIVRAHPAVVIAADAWRRSLRMMTEFGLTPSSRSRLQAPDDGEKENDEWAQMLG